ncbi:MAG: FkbM family methyltransferase [Planctomycetia bacterium]|nr:FkbM family methyltransferase [Planctomycetia bacterium]
MDEKDLKKLYRNSRLKTLPDRIRTRLLNLFFHCGADLGLHKNLGGNFKDYLMNENMPERIAVLRRGLDSISLKELDLALERMKYSPDWWDSCVKNTRTYVDPDYYLCEEEKEANKQFIRMLPEYKRKYPLPIFAHSMEVFANHCGIALLSEKAKKYIEGKDFIDGGAYIGDSALIYLEHNPKKVWSFEISEENSLYYKQTMRMNRVPAEKYELLKAGLAEKTQRCLFQENSGLGANIYGAITAEELNDNHSENSIQFYSIDDFVSEHGLNTGFIRLDVEGPELEIMKGSVNTIRSQRPVLCISIYHNPQEFFETKPFIESLNAGYKFMCRRLSSSMIFEMPFSHDNWWQRHALGFNETNLIAYPEELDD